METISKFSIINKYLKPLDQLDVELYIDEFGEWTTDEFREEKGWHITDVKTKSVLQIRISPIQYKEATRDFWDGLVDLLNWILTDGLYCNNDGILNCVIVVNTNGLVESTPISVDVYIEFDK